MKNSILAILTVLLAALMTYPPACLAEGAGGDAQVLTYPVVDTGQDRCFSDRAEMTYPEEGEPYYGQDAQYETNPPKYRDNGDGTVTDLVTGLMWQKSPDFSKKFTHDEAMAGAGTLRLAGYDDWRVPTIKELYSLIDFRGGCNRTGSNSIPYIDTDYFGFAYGDTSKGERIIDCQSWSSNVYVGTAMRDKQVAFGVNFADGRIKGYPTERLGPPGRMGGDGKFVRYVRGNPGYGINDFVDNGDGTVTDRATGLMWMKKDSVRTMDWPSALEYAEGLEYAGHDDWRLPDAKELQSIVDYTRAPDASDPSQRGPAIDPVFDTTEDESYFWTSTTHTESMMCDFAVYVAFGRAMGIMHGREMNVHGAGAQRSDPKTGDPSDWEPGHGPQGDDIRILNYVRCVRGGDVTEIKSGPPLSGKYSNVKKTGSRGSGPGGQGGQGGPGGMQGPGGMGGQMGGAPSFVEHLDRDGDGKVSRQEFDGPPDAFGHHDANGDGYLTEDEAPQPPQQGGMGGMQDRRRPPPR